MQNHTTTVPPTRTAPPCHPVRHPATHRRIGEASNPGPATDRPPAAQIPECGPPHTNYAECPGCESRWRPNASRAFQAAIYPCTRCGATSISDRDPAGSIRPTRLHFQCPSCAEICCAACAGLEARGTPTMRRTPDRSCPAASSSMSDQSKRRRDQRPTSPEGGNSPGPSSKVRRHTKPPRYDSDEESESSSSSQAEIALPDSVRRILDFDQWGDSSATSHRSGNGGRKRMSHACHTAVERAAD